MAKVLLASCVLVGLAETMPAQAFSFDSMIEDIGNDLKKMGEDVLREQAAPSNKKSSKSGAVQKPGLTASQSSHNHDRKMVANAQGKLTQLGYNAGVADGRYGKKTRLAILAFQRDRGLPAKGNVTPQLLTQLSRETQSGSSSAKSVHTPSSTGYSSQGNSMIAQSPGGGLVAPAQGGGKISSSGGTIRSQSPLITSNQTKVSQASATKLNSVDQLTQDERGKIRGEAKTVYDYCKKRELFSSFHDCSCVSQQFLDTRAQEVAGWHGWQGQDETVDGILSDGRINMRAYQRANKAQRKQAMKVKREQKRQKAFLTGKVDQHSLIGMADKVADACPNKAGVVKYGYSTCITLYEHRLQDNLETFCTCYGDRFSKFYMRDPRSFMPNITSKMSAALTACSEEISPNPFNYND